MYKKVNKKVKKIESEEKSKAYDDLHNKLRTRERNFKLTRIRKRNSGNLDQYHMYKKK